MTATYPRLSTHLDARGCDGYLVDADGDDSTQYYLSGYHAPDDFVTLYTADGITLLVSGLEYTRATTDSDADDVRKLAEFDFQEKATEMDPRLAGSVVTAEFLADADVDSVLVPDSFPVGTADVLREHGISVKVDDAFVLEEIRAVKTDVEVEAIRSTQAANEAAIAVAEDLLDRATVDAADDDVPGLDDDVLRLDGDVLTSETVRRRIERELLGHGCGMDDCIVAAGPAAARGHGSGSGPLRANVPIVVDVFPRDKETRYYGDMTRTFVKGTPSDQVREWYELTTTAFDAALDAIEPGVTGDAVHGAVCDVFEAAGYDTHRTTDAPEDGFTHSTGHGVGLDVHEAPYLAQEGGELEPGHVVTVEPGLYEQGVGGVRLEDLVVVTEDGYRNLTDYPRDLRVL
jgi:Xaa-Pro aminopeptidase